MYLISLIFWYLDNRHLLKWVLIRSILLKHSLFSLYLQTPAFLYNPQGPDTKAVNYLVFILVKFWPSSQFPDCSLEILSLFLAPFLFLPLTLCVCVFCLCSRSDSQGFCSKTASVITVFKPQHSLVSRERESVDEREKERE